MSAMLPEHSMRQEGYLVNIRIKELNLNIDMKRKIGVFYGSTTGETKEVALEIAEALGVDEADVYDVADSAPSDVAPYDVLLLGSSTWGSGDLQDDWYDFLTGLEVLDLENKIVALFGCGDETMADTFGGALGIIYDRLQKTGAQIIGAFDTDGYTYEHSPAEKNGRIVGLIIDNVNHSDLTESRLRRWTDELKAQLL